MLVRTIIKPDEYEHILKKTMEAKDLDKIYKKRGPYHESTMAPEPIAMLLTTTIPRLRIHPEMDENGDRIVDYFHEGKASMVAFKASAHLCHQLEIKRITLGALNMIYAAWEKMEKEKEDKKKEVTERAGTSRSTRSITKTTRNIYYNLCRDIPGLEISEETIDEKGTRWVKFTNDETDSQVGLPVDEPTYQKLKNGKLPAGRIKVLYKEYEQEKLKLIKDDMDARMEASKNGTEYKAPSEGLIVIPWTFKHKTTKAEHTVYLTPSEYNDCKYYKNHPQNIYEMKQRRKEKEKEERRFIKDKRGSISDLLAGVSNVESLSSSRLESGGNSSLLGLKLIDSEEDEEEKGAESDDSIQILSPGPGNSPKSKTPPPTRNEKSLILDDGTAAEKAALAALALNEKDVWKWPTAAAAVKHCRLRRSQPYNQ